MVNYEPNYDDSKLWEKDNKKFIKQIPKIDNEVPSRRNVYPREKEEIWNKAESYPGFNEDLFRKDILGNVCIKGITYKKGLKTNKFAYEHDHVTAYSMGGPTTINNLCLLNAGINHLKYNNSLYNADFYEMKGWCYIYGIAFNNLKHRLLNDLHNTC